MRKEKIIEKTLWLLQTDKFERWLSQMEQDGWMLASFVGPSKCTFRKCEPRKRTYLIITRPGYAGGYMKRLYEDILHNHHGFTVSAENSYYGIVRIKTDDQAEINELLARRNKKLSYYFLSETIAIVLFSVFVDVYKRQFLNTTANTLTKAFIWSQRTKARPHPTCQFLEESIRSATATAVSIWRSWTAQLLPTRAGFHRISIPGNPTSSF